MSVKTGFDYSTFVQPVIDRYLAQGFADAGMERCAMAIDSTDATLTSCENLFAVGIELDGYRELALSQPETIEPDGQDCIEAFRLLTGQKISVGRLYGTAEDVAIGQAPGILIPSLRTFRQVMAQFAIGVYTGGWYWPAYMANTPEFSDLPLWDANYSDIGALSIVRYGNWGRVTVQQYASPVKVAGVPLDLDVFATA